MTWAIKPPFRGAIVDAIYQDPQVEAYRNNPFLEALPPILSEQEAIMRMRYYPHYQDIYRSESSEIRLHYVMDLEKYVQPLRHYREIERMMSRTIRRGYESRNPIQPGFVQNVHQRVDDLTHNLRYDLPSIPRTAANGFAIFGVSGMGKTTAIERTLSLYPQVIRHRKYNDKKVTVDQLVWMIEECPHNGSTKALALKFFADVDDILKTSYSKTHGNPRFTEEVLVQNMSRVALLHGIGVLVIDELQNLSVKKSGGEKEMLNFFVGLVNTIGLPVVLIGTPKAATLLTSEFRQTRRLSGFGISTWDRMQLDEEWEYFIEGLWQYQYTKQPVSLTSKLSQAIYEQSQGITDFAVKIFMLSQIRAIESNVEKITPSIIKSAAKDGFELARSALNALKSNNSASLHQFEDILLDVKPFFNAAIGKENKSAQITSDQIKNSIIYQVASWLREAGYEHDKSIKAAQKAVETLGIETPLSATRKLANSFLFESGSINMSV